MGLIKDALGSALGANQVNNGFNGPKLPFVHRDDHRDSRSSSSFRPQTLQQTQGPSVGDETSRNQFREATNDTHRLGRYHSSEHNRNPTETSWVGARSTPSSPHLSGPTIAELPDDASAYRKMERADGSYQQCPPWPSKSQQWNSRLPQYSQPDSQVYGQYLAPDLGAPRPTGHVFRPLALPQVEYGDGKPFLRGYSYELEDYGISERQFIEIVDEINVAIIPNPEVQIFQKAASIAGFFIPGSASVALMGGQVAAGVGAAFGHASIVARALSKSNLEVFIPKGLEICIGKTVDVNKEVGLGSSQPDLPNDVSPRERIAVYENMIAPVSSTFPHLQSIGRQDPIAAVGRALGDRQSDKKVEKAHKKVAKGKFKDMNALEGGVKWLMVRRATPRATAHWQRTLAESDAAITEGRRSA